jgi:hypothetical protein
LDGQYYQSELITIMVIVVLWHGFDVLKKNMW